MSPRGTAWLRPLWLAAARRAARAYVAGSSVEDAVRAARRYASRGLATTIGYWNDSDEAPSAVQRAYLDSTEALARRVPGGYVSIKLAALGYDDALLAPVLARAAAAGFRVHFDSLGPETVDPTNEAIERARGVHDDLGCTLPSRWRRSVEDAEWAVAAGLVVRVVKGQWEDPDAPDRDPQAGFLEVIDRLAGRARHVAVATHDVALAGEALARLARRDMSVELELLHGLPLRRSLALARRRGLACRVYVPYGEAWLPYSLAYVQRKPAVVLWLARDLLGG